MRFKLEADHYFPGDIYVERDTIVGDDTAYPLPEDFVPSRYMTPLDQQAEERLAAFEEKPDPLSELALPSRIRPEDAQIPAGKPGQPNKDQSPPDEGSSPDLSLPKTNENVSGSKKK